MQNVEEVNPHALAFSKYLEALFALRRKTPGDDLISQLLQVEAEGDKLSTGELFSLTFLLISSSILSPSFILFYIGIDLCILINKFYLSFSGIYHNIMWYK